MATYPNFYQQINEANMRLRNTVILYKGDPHLVLAVSNHKGDGIFRVYLDPLPLEEGQRMETHAKDVPYRDYEDFDESAQFLDEYMSDNPGTKIIRRKINSPHFNKFRPFPLGMCEIQGYNGSSLTAFTQRRPTRRVEQGLTPNMVSNEIVSIRSDPEKNSIYFHPYVYSYHFAKTIKGVYPTIDEALSSLTGEYQTVAFRRDMAVCSGPVGVRYLFYKEDAIGLLPEGDTSVLKLDRRFNYTKELLEETKLFKEIRN